MKRLKVRQSDAVVKLIRLMAPEGSASLSDEDLASPDFLISTEELESFDVAKLQPRFHLQALESLIEQGIFEHRAQACQIKDSLKEKAATTSENKKKKKEQKQKNDGEKKKQMTLFAFGVSHH